MTLSVHCTISSYISLNFNVELDANCRVLSCLLNILHIYVLAGNRKDWIQMNLLKNSRILTFARTWRALMKDVFLGAMQSSAKLYKSKCPDRIWWNTIGRSVCLRLFYYQRNPVCEAGSPRQTWYLSHFLHQYVFGPANLYFTLNSM